jgi:hypothetical protein
MKTATRKSKMPYETGDGLTPVLERDEWFFNNVPGDEVVTCFYYEYARSRDDICRLVCSWRAKLANLDKACDKETATQAFWRALAQLTDWTCSQLLVNFPEFPSQPWQKIRPAKRAKWKRLLTFYSDLDNIRGGLRRESIDKLVYAIGSGDMDTRFGEIVPFFIDWRGGIEKVISDFEKWARKHYSELHLPRKKKPRDTYYEWLKQLGVMRLKGRLGSWDAVQDYTCKALGCKLLYEDDHALWRKARLAAIKRIREMFPITRAH